jgi:hypothetical protein
MGGSATRDRRLPLLHRVLHAPVLEGDGPDGSITELTQFQKDIGLLGAALVFFAVTAFGKEFGPTLTDPLFSL